MLCSTVLLTAFAAVCFTELHFVSLLVLGAGIQWVNLSFSAGALRRFDGK